MKPLSLRVLEGNYAIHKFPSDTPFPVKVMQSNFLSVTKTSDELSIVCDASIDIDSPQKEADWSCLKVLGPLDFSLTGILAKLSAVLAEAGISIFAISTYDTDYILVKSDSLDTAILSLSDAGYIIK